MGIEALKAPEDNQKAADFKNLFAFNARAQQEEQKGRGKKEQKTEKPNSVA